METAFKDKEQFYGKDGKMDIKTLKEYSNTMKNLNELIRDLKTQQMLMEPIKVIMGEAEKYAN